MGAALSFFILALCMAPRVQAEAALPVVVPTKSFVLNGGGGAEVFLFLWRGTESQAPLSLAVMRMADGEEVFLLASLNPETGIARQRMDHPATGWFAEWNLDMGFRNIDEVGSVGDGTTFDWLKHSTGRFKEESEGETFTIETADGAFASWFHPQGGDAESLRDQQAQALAKLVPEVEETAPPETVLAAVKTLSNLVRSNSEADMSEYDELLENLATLFATARLTPEADAEDKEAPIELQRRSLNESPERVEQLRREVASYAKARIRGDQ